MAALITLCNRALAEIGKGEVADLAEGSLEARECNRFAPAILEEMVEWSDSFPFARKRVVLALVANDRPAEWLYAYAAPDDMASPLAIRRVEEAAEDLPIAGPYTFPWQDMEPLAFGYEGNRIFSNVENATLIYSKKTLDAADLPALGQRAFVLELASRMAMPLAKDPKIAERVMRMAELARQRFIADEENKSPRATPRYVSEVEYARMGIGV